MDFIQIDGSYLEGGGSIVRLASAFSMLTQKPVRIYNIRKGRPQPGLKTQHLRGLEAIAQLCNGKLENAKLGSTEVLFYPGKIPEGMKEINIKIETAGSIGLVLQSLLIACLHIKEKLTVNIEGGATFGEFAPPLPFTNSVFLPLLRKMGYHIEMNILKYGFYPAGGGKTQVIINPCKQLQSLNLVERGGIKLIEGISIASNHLKKPKVAERQARIAEAYAKEDGHSAEIKTRYVDSICPGSGVVLFAKTDNTVLGASALGERGKTAEAVGTEAINRLLEQFDSGACLDEWAGDQIMPYMALAGKSSISVSKITNHLLTNIWLCEQMLGVKFRVEGVRGETGRISVD